MGKSPRCSFWKCGHKRPYRLRDRDDRKPSLGFAADDRQIAHASPFRHRSDAGILKLGEMLDTAHAPQVITRPFLPACD